MSNPRRALHRSTEMAKCVLAATLLVLAVEGCDVRSRKKSLKLRQSEPDGVAVSELDLAQMEITTHPAGGPCNRCHASGGGRSRQTKKPIPQLCYDCHDDYGDRKKYLHGPVAAGACLFCHEPHSSIYVHLQKVSQPRLCTRCHDTEDYMASETHPDASGRLCTECHDPHAGSRQMFLRK